MSRINLVVFLLAAVLVFGCGSNDTKTSTTTEKTTENKTDTKTTTKTETATDNGLKYAKIGNVTESSGSKVAPNFTWQENGKEMSLSGLKGKVVLVNMWATWCGPCIKEMPDLSALSEEYKDKDFKMVGVSVFPQEGTKKVDEFLKTNPVSYWVVEGNEQVVNAFSKADGSEINGIRQHSL